jgi:trehalose 6-phosphate phosphatase
MAWDVLAPIRARPERSAVICDVDGTIAPIVERPEEAVIPDRVRELLRRLQERYALVGCVSGRRALDARRIVGIESLAYAGNHGLEYLPPHAGRPEVLGAPGKVAELRDFVRSAYSPELRERGIRLEDKDPIWSFHWREAPDEGSAHERLALLAEEAEENGFVAHWGRKVLEIRPRLASDKGTVITKMLGQVAVDAALYGGDDVTDLDAFRALHALQARGELEHSVCVGVRSDEGPVEIVHEADLVVEGTGGFVEVLEALVP